MYVYERKKYIGMLARTCMYIFWWPAKKKKKENIAQTFLRSLRRFRNIQSHDTTQNKAFSFFISATFNSTWSQRQQTLRRKKTLHLNPWRHFLCKKLDVVSCWNLVQVNNGCCVLSCALHELCWKAGLTFSQERLLPVNVPLSQPGTYGFSPGP